MGCLDFLEVFKEYLRIFLVHFDFGVPGMTSSRPDTKPDGEVKGILNVPYDICKRRPPTINCKDNQ